MGDSRKSFLLDMGLDEGIVDLALRSCPDKEVVDVVQWYFDYLEGSGSQGGSKSAVSSSSAVYGQLTKKSDEVVNSLKCNECGQLFKSTEAATNHATSIGHTDFSESSEAVKSLSAEEVKERAARLREKMTQLRQQRETNEKKLEIENEKKRRVLGQELAATRERLQLQEMQKLVEDRKKDKLEDARTRNKILEQIKQDRLRQKTTTMDPKPSESSRSSVPSCAQSATAADVCNIQLRFPCGSVVKKTFKPDDTFEAVYQIAAERMGDQFSLSSNYPRQDFSEQDVNSTLRDLQLLPSATLFVSKKL